MNNNKQDKGFTLVELLIVIVILGILATVTVFAVHGITDQGQDNACAVDARTLNTAEEAFYAQNQRDAVEVREFTIGPVVAGTVLADVDDTTADAVFTADEAVLQDVPSNYAFNAATGQFAAVDPGPCAP